MRRLQGMPYKYVVEVDSRPFKDAQEVLLLALNRLTWATKSTVPAAEYLKPNELLTLGYLEKMSIGVCTKLLSCWVPDITDVLSVSRRWRRVPRPHDRDSFARSKVYDVHPDEG